MRIVFAALATVSTLLFGCQPTIDTGAECGSASDCSAPLVCRLGRCRAECSQNRDCPAAARCLLDATGLGSCSLDTDERCESGGHMCPTGLICVGDHCANSCARDSDCPPDAVCRDEISTGVRFCFDPEREDAGPPSDAGRLDAASDANVGRDAPQIVLDAYAADVGRDLGMQGAPDMGATVDAAADSGGSDANLGDAGTDVSVPDGGPCIGAGCGAATEICALPEATCAIRDDGHVVCWGRDTWLADGPTTTTAGDHPVCAFGRCSSSPIAVRREDGSNLIAQDIACNGGVACARTSTGDVYCWGSALNDGLGDPLPGGDPVAYRAVLEASTFVQGHTNRLLVGAHFACAVVDADTLCWGENDNGVLGATTIGDGVGPTAAGSLLAGAGAFVVCEVSGASVRCRGSDQQGELGPHATGDSSTFVALDPFPNAVTFVGGNSQGTMCVLAGTDVWCWGSAFCGALGNGVASSGYVRTPVHTGSGYSQLWISVTGPRICAQTATGQTDCWGTFTCGSSGDAEVPTHVPELDGATHIAISAESICQITPSGTVMCAGVDDYGQIGRLPLSSAFDPTFETVCIADGCVF